MKKKWIMTGLISCMAFPAFAQEKVEKETKKGDAIITIYSDFHSGFGSVNNERGFNLERAYVGYQYSLGHGLQIKGVVDFGQSKDVGDYQRIGFIKNAQLTWKQGKWTLNAGLISTTQFKIQEDFWGKRYVMKSFQDEYKFGSSADLAFSAAYQFNNYLSADVILANGEGYKKVQIKDGLQYGAGLTLTPLEGLTVRAYGSYNEASEEGQKGITNLAAFVGFHKSGFSVAAEYNYMSNTSFTENQDRSGASVYAMMQVSKHVNLFGRWDYLTSKNQWDEANEGNAGMIGVDVKLGKYVRLAPNFRIWSPKQDDLTNRYYAYLNASFSI